MQSRQRPFNRDAAFTRTELIFNGVVVALVVAMAALALTQARYKRQRRACVNNLKNIGLAFRISIVDGGDRYLFDISTTNGGTKEYTNVWQHFIVLSNELSTPKVFICPVLSKAPASSWHAFSDRNISYFIGLSAAEMYPNSFLAGDAGILIEGHPPQSNPISLSSNASISYPTSIHRAIGNIGVGDGSVQQLDSNRLKQSLRNSGLATNVLLLPR